MESPFAGKVRVRVNGILIEQGRMLLVQLQSPTRKRPFWTPPGGGVQFGETLEEALKREFVEETGLHVRVRKLLFVSEYVQPPWHAVDHYFLVELVGGSLVQGNDPELGPDQQMIRDIQFMDRESIRRSDLVPQFLQERLDSLMQGGSDKPEWIR